MHARIFLMTPSRHKLVAVVTLAVPCPPAPTPHEIKPIGLWGETRLGEGIKLVWDACAAEGFVAYKVVRSKGPNPSYLPATEGTQRAFAFGVVSGGKTIGVLAFSGRSQGAPDERLQQIVRLGVFHQPALAECRDGLGNGYARPQRDDLRRSRRADGARTEGLHHRLAAANAYHPRSIDIEWKGIRHNRPARIRTRNASFEARYDGPFHHRGVERKARESNPHLASENRFSRAARPTVSGYLPNSGSGGRTRQSRLMRPG